MLSVLDWFIYIVACTYQWSDDATESYTTQKSGCFIMSSSYSLSYSH